MRNREVHRFIKASLFWHVLHNTHFDWKQQIDIFPLFSKTGYINGRNRQSKKNLNYGMQQTWVRSLGWEDSLEKEMSAHSSILAWRISWTEEPDRLQSMGSQRVRHNWATNTATFNVYVSTLLSLSHACLSPLRPQPCSLCAHLYSCPANRVSEVGKRKTSII